MPRDCGGEGGGGRDVGVRGAVKWMVKAVHAIGYEMAHFLRDEQLTDLTIDEEALKQIDAAFKSRLLSTPERESAEDASLPEVFISYVIRFDNKGYRVFLLEDVLAHFQEAGIVERVIFSLESAQSVKSSRLVGSYLELRLDVNNSSNCFLTATSDDSDWVDSSFSAVSEVLVKRKNRNALARSTWTQLIVQLSGVVLGFALSLWAGSKIAEHLEIENAFLISFLLVLLLFSNFWTYIAQSLYALVNRVFPNLRFLRPSRDRSHWLLQAIIGGVVVALTLYLLGLVLSYSGSVLGAFVK